MERIMLMCDMMKKEDSLGKLLFQTMRSKRTTGLCEDLAGAFEKFGMDKNNEIFTKEAKEIRQIMKGRIVEMQSGKLGIKMLEESKTDTVIAWIRH